MNRSRPSPVLLSLGVAVLAASMSGCDRDADLPPAPPPVDTEARNLQVSVGRDHYEQYCALCHGANAEGYAADHANAIGNPDFLRVATDGFLRAAIRDGRPGTPMSAWGREHGGPLDSAAVDALVVYLRSLATEPPIDVSGIVAQGSVDQGGALYSAQCARCHGARGEGTETATSLAHVNFHATASDGLIRWTIEHGRRGTPMTAFGDLPPHSLDNLVAFLRSMAAEAGPSGLPEPGAPPPTVEQLVIHPEGAPPPFELRDNRFVPAEQVRRALEAGQRLVILDARAASDWARAHIPGAAPFPFYDIEQLADRLPKDGTWIVAYCACPHAASGHVVDALRERGFEHTAVLDEGIPFWQSQGWPVERGTVPTP